MAAQRNIHTVKNGDRWENEEEGGRKLGGSYETQAEAREAGREEARRLQSEHLIHGEDGEIRERNSYGNDPHPPRG